MQFLVYILVYPFLWLISILPFRLLYAFSDFVYLFVFRIFGYRKKTVKENLRLVFPDKSKEEINRITKVFYHHLCDMIVESIKSMTISEAEMKKRFTFTNIDVIKAIEEQNKSIILMCAHYGSWEWIFILQTYVKYRGNAVYKRLANKYFDRLVKRIRAKYNSYLITTKETVPTLIDLKRKGILTINGFVSDQSPKPSKAFHWNEFMGLKVPVYTGAEMLAKKLDMAVVFFKVKKLKRGYYETTFETITLNPKEYKDYEITDIFLKLVEQQIYEAPEYYLWTHKRWKHRDKVPEKFL
ncbi:MULTISPECIES: lysophospholipid acyltransferase family protein [Flavobacteriaceae]|jgi:KDO2-lipid IV(A) lauroyltransferase|uniref:KDO2-lipid IV(A) lauroyltransferase n=1 Tax=Meridianimaribacter flavus TaxID=571115 RepID=A0ABY2G3S1_9FLAO|nr:MULTISPECIES: lysophospholipid acyltransferase family protein [Meridianimaribacter]TBV26012.1 lipid A biosynthesis acyltransferase [Meridianimaribacter sp. CL38]TDY11421.1 KDO2-lipid IV(A) lauroyltransferase [Meridianimaribacter flavus]